MTKLLTSKDINEAADIIRRGGIVGIPTETVYGLGANALDSAAVAKIFTAKGRPSDNPLIVHVASISAVSEVAHDICDTAYALMERFFPGALTIVLPKREVVPYATTAGLDTVAVRCPAHPIARAVITASGVPIAAPSANLSGKPSPTAAAHVMADMSGRIDAVLDDGECGIGLESTVVAIREGKAVILRSGGVTMEQLSEVCPTIMNTSHAEKPVSPGQKYKHYAPDAPLFFVDEIAEVERVCENYAKVGVICVGESELPHNCIVKRAEDTSEYARILYAALREFDSIGVDCICAIRANGGGIAAALEDRLSRAAIK